MGGLRSRAIAGGAIAILATALLVATAHAMDCVSETPLPADVKLTLPGTNVPADLARFAGAWTGVWDGDVCSALVVEEVFANGVARVVYSRGTSEALKIRQPRYWRATWAAGPSRRKGSSAGRGTCRTAPGRAAFACIGTARRSSSTRSIDGSSGPPGAYPAIRSATDPSPLRKTAWPRGAYGSSG
jgi:hypothetical protein